MKKKVIDFYGDEINLIRHENIPYCSVESLCKNLNLDYNKESEKIKQTFKKEYYLSDNRRLYLRYDFISIWVDRNKIQIDSRDEFMKYKFMKYAKELDDIVYSELWE